jgi:hypothetical protein
MKVVIKERQKANRNNQEADQYGCDKGLITMLAHIL